MNKLLLTLVLVGLVSLVLIPEAAEGESDFVVCILVLHFLCKFILCNISVTSIYIINFDVWTLPLFKGD